MKKPGLVLIQGLFTLSEADASVTGVSAQEHRERAFAEHGETLGVIDYEWVSGRGKAVANRLLRLARRTAPAVDAVEIIELDEASFRASLVNKSAQQRWREIASCEPYGLDAARSFILIGSPIQLLEGCARGQRVLWFGRGLGHLSDAEFVAHYTGHHGPLVAGHARPLGLRWYRQVPGEEAELCAVLRGLGLGQANAPAVFAELIAGAPPLSIASLRERRRANREIATDEKRHIDFPRSMLLLA
jgi:hypothetical protein